MLFSKRNRKHVLHVSIELYKHSWKFGRTRKSCGDTRLRLVFPQHFSFSQTSTRVCITQIETRYMFSISKIMGGLLQFSNQIVTLKKTGCFPVRKVISPYHRGNKGVFIKNLKSFRRGYQWMRHAGETGLSDRGLEYSELCVRSAGVLW